MPEGDKAALGARWLACGIPGCLLGGAYLGQYGFGLFPCELCWWQRYALFIALALASGALVWPQFSKIVVSLAAIAILVSGLIGGYHAGVEYGWWQGFTACTARVAFTDGADPLAAIMAGPLIRCDQVQWQILGISLAGFNFLISGPAALLILILLHRSRRSAACVR